MKSKIFFVIIALLALTLVTCDSGTTDDTDGVDKNGDKSRSITITGTPKVGEKLTATSTGDFLDKFFFWAYSYEGEYWFQLMIGISGENNSEFIIPNYKMVGGPDLVGKYIVAYKQTINGDFRSNVLGPITE